MNTTEILNVLNQDLKIKPALKGVFCRNKLPVIDQLPLALVANTDSSKGPGEHWVGIFLPIDGKPLYWDSYGFPPRHKEFKDFMPKNFDCNDVQLQSPFSSACGQHCIFFLAMACRGCTLKEIQNCFSEDLIQNDRLVTEFINRNYNVNTCAYDPDFLMQQVSKFMNDVLNKS